MFSEEPGEIVKMILEDGFKTVLTFKQKNQVLRHMLTFVSLNLNGR